MVTLNNFFNDLIAASRILPETLIINDLKECLNIQELDYWTILEMNKHRLEFCLKHKKAIMTSTN